MNKNIQENFERTRIAGSIASGALDEVCKIIKPGMTTDDIDNLCYEYINDYKAFSLLYIIEVFQNLVVLQLITLFVMEYLLIKF